MDRTLSPRTPIDSPRSPNSPAYDWRNAQTGTGQAVTIVRSGRATPPAKLETKTSFEFIYDTRRASYLDDTPVEENGLPWPEEAGPPPVPARAANRTNAGEPMSEARLEKLDLERIQSAYGAIKPPTQTHPAHFAPYADPSPTSPCPLDSSKIAVMDSPNDFKYTVINSPAEDDPVFLASAAFISTFSPTSSSTDSFASRHSTDSSSSGANTSNSTAPSSRSTASSRGPAPLHHLPIKTTSPNTPHVPPPKSPFILFSPYDNIDATPYHAFPSSQAVTITQPAAPTHAHTRSDDISAKTYTPLTWSNTQAPKRRWYSALRSTLRTTLISTNTAPDTTNNPTTVSKAKLQRPQITVLRDAKHRHGQPLGPHRLHTHHRAHTTSSIPLAAADIAVHAAEVARAPPPPTPPKIVPMSTFLQVQFPRDATMIASSVQRDSQREVKDARVRGLSVTCDATRHPSLVPLPLQVVKSPRSASAPRSAVPSHF